MLVGITLVPNNRTREFVRDNLEKNDRCQYGVYGHPERQIQQKSHPALLLPAPTKQRVALIIRKELNTMLHNNIPWAKSIRTFDTPDPFFRF